MKDEYYGLRINVSSWKWRNSSTLSNRSSLWLNEILWEAVIAVTLKKVTACTISKRHNENAAHEAINITRKQQTTEQTTDCICKSSNWIGRAVQLNLFTSTCQIFSAIKGLIWWRSFVLKYTRLPLWPFTFKGTIKVTEFRCFPSLWKEMDSCRLVSGNKAGQCNLCSAPNDRGLF